jgi:hypothetical protein
LKRVLVIAFLTARFDSYFMENKLTENEKVVLAAIANSGNDGIDTVNLKRFFNKKMKYNDLVLSYNNLVLRGLVEKKGMIRVDVGGESVIARVLKKV